MNGFRNTSIMLKNNRKFSGKLLVSISFYILWNYNLFHSTQWKLFIECGNCREMETKAEHLWCKKCMLENLCFAVSTFVSYIDTMTTICLGLRGIDFRPVITVDGHPTVEWCSTAGTWRGYGRIQASRLQAPRSMAERTSWSGHPHAQPKLCCLKN